MTMQCHTALQRTEKYSGSITAQPLLAKGRFSTGDPKTSQNKALTARKEKESKI
jgi:hypothetical protein